MFRERKNVFTITHVNEREYKFNILSNNFEGFFAFSSFSVDIYLCGFWRCQSNKKSEAYLHAPAKISHECPQKGI